MNEIICSVPCHSCGFPGLITLAKFSTLGRVSSDSRPWPRGGGLGVCQRCALVQKVVDDAWRQEARQIYESYQLYHQSVGLNEQVLFDKAGVGIPRSRLILKKILGHLTLPPRGRMLDVGCGSGPTLRAFSALVPGWSLYGFEPHGADRSRLLAIPDVREVYSESLAAVPGEFDLVVVNHVLEHIENPVPFLQGVAARLAKGGVLLVQVPCFVDHLFDVMNADHCTHYTLPTLEKVLREAGLAPMILSREIIPREILVLARSGPLAGGGGVDVAAHVRAAAGCLDWLEEMLRQAMAPAPAGLGIFGTSIGGNWLLGALAERVGFFVDEDPNRVGTLYRNRPIHSPAQVPRGSRVVMPMPPAMANPMVARLQTEDFQLVPPPPYAAPHGL